MCTQRGSRAEPREMRSGRPEMTDAFKDTRKNVGLYSELSKKLWGEEWCDLVWIASYCSASGSWWEGRWVSGSQTTVTGWYPPWFLVHDSFPRAGNRNEISLPGGRPKKLTFSSPKRARKIRIFFPRMNPENSLWVCPNFDWQPYVVTYRANTQQSHFQVQTNK